MKTHQNNTILYTIMVFYFLALSNLMSAQDIIIKNSGDEIMANVVEVMEDKIKYRRAEQTNGPVYSIAIHEVFMVRYEDGTKDVFNKPNQPAPAAKPKATPPPTPTPPAYSPSTNTSTNYYPEPSPSASIDPVNNDDSGSAFYLAYHGSPDAELSIYMGYLSDNMGWYLGARASSSIFGEVSLYNIENGQFDDDFWIFIPSGNFQYRRGSITTGLTAKLAGRTGNVSLHSYAGIGYGVANYMYEYDQIGPGTFDSYGYEWIKDSDLSVAGLETEAGFILDLYGFNLNIGTSSVNFQDYILTLGVGLAF